MGGLLLDDDKGFAAAVDDSVGGGRETQEELLVGVNCTHLWLSLLLLSLLLPRGGDQRGRSQGVALNGHVPILSDETML